MGLTTNPDGTISVDLLEESRTGIDNGGIALEFNGIAENVVIDPMDSMNGSLRVNDYCVVTRAGQTSIRKGNRSFTLDDFIQLIEELGFDPQVKVRGLSEVPATKECDDQVAMVPGLAQVFALEIKLQEELDEDEDGATVLICHRPPGNPDNAKTLEVSPAAAEAHLSNHPDDTSGACP